MLTPRLQAPAQEAIEYEDVVFTSNIYTKGPKTPKTEYSGPLTDQNDAAWKRLTHGKAPSCLGAALCESSRFVSVLTLLPSPRWHGHLQRRSK